MLNNACAFFPLSPRRTPPTPRRLSLPVLALLGLLLPLAQPAGAQPTLVADLDTTAAGSRPTSFVAVGDRVYFSADRSDVGREIFVSDGTAEGTQLFVDANPGPPSSAQDFASTPRPMVAAGDRFYFIAETYGVGSRLWTATADGAEPLAAGDATVGGALRASEILGAFGNRVLFVGYDPLDNDEPWISDGTPGGTRQLGDLAPGIATSSPRHFATEGDLAYFGARTPEHGFELWRTDGTPEGTQRLTDFFGTGDGLCAKSEKSLASTGRGVLFPARKEGLGCEPWITDGTAGGTRLLTETAAGESGRGVDTAFEADGRVFFNAGVQLWVTDGTEAGTRPVLTAGFEIFNVSFGQLGDEVFFAADPNGSGVELWASDGTPEGTRQVLDLETGPSASAPQNFASVPGAVVFTAETSSFGRELYVTDGTAQGTRVLRDIAPGTADADPEAVAVAGRLWISANDRSHGPEPWISDGTEAGTRLVRDIDTDGTLSSGITSISSGGELAVFEFFNGGDPIDPTQERLWVSDGTEAGTRPMEDPPGFTVESPGQLTPTSQGLYFTASDPSFGQELLRFEGDGPPRVFDLEPGPQGSNPAHLREAGENIFFTRIIDGAFELWRLNPSGDSASFLGELLPPTASGTAPDTAPGEKGPYCQQSQIAFKAFGGQLAALIAEDTDGDSFPEPTDVEWLWTSDGTPAGTARRRQVTVLTSTHPAWAAVADQFFYFDQVEDGQFDLWRTGGNAGPTERIASFTELGATGGPEFLVGHRGRAFFGFLNNDFCFDYWSSDGTPGGTERLDVPCAARPVSLAGQLYFIVNSPELGRELWRLVGDPARAELVIDLEPGPDGGTPFLEAESPGIAYFVARTGDLGDELWRTDGTADGTQVLGDIAPGPDGSSISQVAVTDRQLFFIADDRIHGREPWTAPLTCVPSPETLCLGDGQFQVKVRWRNALGNFGEGFAQTRPLTDDSGAFWFFDERNLELAVKVLDGRALTGAYWVFYASLSNVEFEIEVLDTVSGQVARYRNEAGSMASVGDTSALPSSSREPAPGGISDALAAPVAPAAPVSPVAEGAPVDGPTEKALCQDSAQVLCLGDGRFEVTTRWRDFEGRTGVGGAGRLSDDTGTFWFFDAQNVELLIKILDGTGLNGRYWVFYGALSNVEFDITVRDLETGAEKTYRNPSGTFASRADTDAF